MTTANELIESAALKLGAKDSGESLTSSESNDSLSVLNSMLENMGIKKLMVYQIVQESFTWPALASSRTIGTAGNFNASRPYRIEEGTYFQEVNNQDYPVNIIRNRSTYDAIIVKNTTSTYPNHIFYDPAYPLGVLYVYPVPDVSLTLKLNSWKTLQNFSTLTTDLSLPPGYRWMIEHNLAVALEAVFSFPPPANVVREAKSSMSDLMRVNHIPVTATTDTFAVLKGVGVGNIKAGY